MSGWAWVGLGFIAFVVFAEAHYKYMQGREIARECERNYRRELDHLPLDRHPSESRDQWAKRMEERVFGQ